MTETPTPVSFLTADESTEVDIALLSSSEKFLTRLTISSLRVLQQIGKDQGIAIEDLTPQQIIRWFENDSKIKREQGIEAAFLKW